MPKLLLLLLTSAVVYGASDKPDPTAAFQQALKKQQESLDQQKTSLHTQLAGKAMESKSEPVSYFIEPLAPLPQADCERLDASTVDSLIAAAAKKQSLEPALLRAVMKQESGFNPCAVSIRGAQGLMQLMPATAQLLHVDDAFDPEQNVQGGAAFLKQLLTRYKGDLRLALVAYNAGTLRADQPADAPYPMETQNYLASIFAQLGISQAPALSDNLEPALLDPSVAEEQTEAEPVPAKPEETAPPKETEPAKEAEPAKPAKP